VPRRESTNSTLPSSFSKTPDVPTAATGSSVAAPFLHAFFHCDQIGEISAIAILLRAHGDIISRFQVGDGVVALTIGHPGIVVVSHKEFSARVCVQFDLASPSVNIANLANKITPAPIAIIAWKPDLAQLGTSGQKQKAPGQESQNTHT
jgi:hypothetical protein